MRRGYNRIFWGLVFSIFHINLGVLQILPAFVCWLIIAHGVSLLNNEYDTYNFDRAHLFAIITFGVSLIGDIATLIGFNSEILIFLPLVFAIVELLFINYLLKGSIEYLYSIEEPSMAVAYEGKLKIFIISFIMNTILQCFRYTISSEGLSILALIIGFILIFWLLSLVYQLKKVGQEDCDDDMDF
jgi:hypothetical protein